MERQRLTFSVIMLNAQLFLQPQFLPYREHGLSK
jgi:hypothetical protein